MDSWCNALTASQKHLPVLCSSLLLLLLHGTQQPWPQQAGAGIQAATQAARRQQRKTPDLAVWVHEGIIRSTPRARPWCRYSASGNSRRRSSCSGRGGGCGGGPLCACFVTEPAQLPAIPAAPGASGLRTSSRLEQAAVDAVTTRETRQQDVCSKRHREQASTARVVEGAGAKTADRGGGGQQPHVRQGGMLQA
jgi:hypothetical protein